MFKNLPLSLLLCLSFACTPVSDTPKASVEVSVPREIRARRDLVRLFKARLNSFPHAPFQASQGVVRLEPPKLGLQDLARLQAPFEQEPDEGWSASAHHAKAITLLFLESGEESLSLARHHLETATTMAPKESSYWNDLAATIWTQSQATGDMASLTQAYASIGHSLMLEPEKAEAQFNQGFIFESLGLFEKARQSWQQYLALETAPEWRLEAETELQQLRATAPDKAMDLKGQLPNLVGDKAALGKAVSQARTLAWRLFERELLPAWGRGSDVALVQGQTLANALYELNGDRLYKDSLVPILESEVPPKNLRQAHRLFSSGHKALEEERLPEAKKDLGQAFALMREASSAFQYRVAYYLALIDQLQGRYALAAEKLEKLIVVAEENNYLNLMGEALWVKGQCESFQAKPDKALATYQSAVPVFQALGGIDNLCGIHYKVATSLFYLGEQQRGWHQLFQALQLLPRVTKPLRVYQVYMLATDGALRGGHPALARDYQRAAVTWAETSGSEWAIATAELWGARLDFLLGDYQAATASLESARKRVAQFPSPSLRQQMEADCLAVWGDMAQNAAALEDALDQLDARNNLVNKASLLCSLARVYLKLGQSDEAVVCLEESLGIYESFRLGLSDQLRSRLFNDVEGIFNEMIALRLDRGEFQAAFDYQEAKRARLLLDQSARTSDPKYQAQITQNWQEIQAALGEQALVVFAVEDQYRMVWFLSKTEFRAHRLQVPLAQLREQIELFRTQMKRRAPLANIRDQARKLYEMLLGPLEESLNQVSELTIVADGPLHGLPFAALNHPKKGFLAARMTLTAAPSAHMFLQSLKLAESRQSGYARALLIGNPRFESDRFPQLPPLGLREHQSLQNLYGSRSTSISDAEATASAFFAHAGRHQILHFNGHAIVNAHAWPRSLLLFARDDERKDGALFARDLAGISLPQTQLAILSACSTGFGTPTGTEGIANLARPFLAAGVPAVVASLWDVEDVATTELMVRFHRSLLKGMAPDRALTDAARELMQSPNPKLNHPSVWSSFLIYGKAPGFRFEKMEKKVENSQREAVHGEDR